MLFRSKRNSQSISRQLFVRIISIISFLSLIAIVYFVLNELNRFDKEKNYLREEYYQQQKNFVKTQVNYAVSYIEYQKGIQGQKLHNELEHKVENAYLIAKNIYEKNKSQKTDREITHLICEALRPIRFDKGRGFYFVVGLDGKHLLAPIKPDVEGNNSLNLKDQEGNYVIRDEIKLVKEKGSGFITNFWKKPGDGHGMIHPKLSFVKLFEPLNFYLGTGEYLLDYENDIKNEVLNRISKIRFGNEGYVFVNTYDGDALITDGQVVTEKRNIWELEDPNGVKVIQDERKAVENPEGDYIYYVWNKLTKPEPAPKISFLKGIEDWQWMIGAGVYVDEIEDELKILKSNVTKQIFINIIKAVSIILLIYLILFIMAKRYSQKVHKNVEKLNKFFKDASESSIEINPNNIEFHEFKSIANSANKMLKSRNIAENDLKIAKEKAEDSDRLKTAFLSNMSHEIRTPMNAIIGFSELLSDNMENESRKKYISIIKNSGNSLMNLINDIIDIAKIESGQLNIQKEITNIYNVLIELESTYQNKIESLSKNIDIKLKSKINHEFDSIIADQNRLKQVFTNLIDNAIKFTYKGEIEFGIESKSDDELVFYVRDTGIGIPKEKQKVIFNRFTQAESSLSRRFGGTGLGLSISKSLVELMGGKIWFETQEEIGTTFFYSIKYEPFEIKTNIEIEQENKDVNYDWNGKSILIIEDNIPNFLLLKAYLEDTNAKIIHAIDGKSGLNIYYEGTFPSIVLLDIQLPDISGYEVAKKIKEIDKKSKIIAQTAFAMTEDRTKALENNCDEYLAKPIKKKKLLSQIQKLLN